MGLGVSASTIKSWFQYRCERKTRYELMDPDDRAAVPVVQDERERPWADLGIGYEKRVLARLAKTAEVMIPGAKDYGLSERRTTAFLLGKSSAQYASQVNLKPRRRPAFMLNAPSIEFRRTYADLVYRHDSGSTPVFQVIDVKAARRATAFHKAQVAFYVRMLESILWELRAPGQVASIGSIWRIPEDGYAEGDTWYEEDFSLTPYLRLVDDLLQRTLPDIAKKTVSHEIDETFFHIYFKCEQCAYLPHCRRALNSESRAGWQDVSATPGLTHKSKLTLLRVGIRTVGELAAAEGLRRLDGAGWALLRRAETLIDRARALRDGAVRRAVEPHSFLMPPRSDVALYLVADHDPVDDTLVTIGYLKVEDGHAAVTVEVLETPNRIAEADALVRIFGRLIADLQRVDQINRGHLAGLYAHIFFYEPAEAVNLQSALRRHLDDPRVRTGLLHLVRLFPPEEVVPEPEYRGMHHLPATAVRSVVEQLYALPVLVAYDLRQVSAALADAGLIETAYRPEQPFAREFSSLLSLEVSRALREKRPGAVDAEAVRKDVAARLQTTRAISEWLQAEHRKGVKAGEPPMLRLAKKPFRLHDSFHPLEPGDLDVLQAFELLENRSGLLDALIRLAQPLHARRDAQRCAADLWLRRSYRSGRSQILLFDVPQESRDAEIGPDDFGLILTDDDPDHRLDPGAWDQFGCKIDPRRPSDPPARLRVRVRAQAFESVAFQTVFRRAGERGWCIDQTFFDVNTQKASAFLSHLARWGQS